MNPYLNEDLQALGEHVERFAQGRVAPGFLERDQTRVLDRALMREMGQMGFIAPELPEAVGGQGMGSLAAGVIHEAIAKAKRMPTDIQASNYSATMQYLKAVQATKTTDGDKVMAYLKSTPLKDFYSSGTIRADGR